MRPILLASASQIRLSLLQSAGLMVQAHPVRIDEEAIRASLAAEGASPRDMADTLAQLKAARLADKFPQSLVLGCDQTLDLSGECLAKAETRQEAADQLCRLRGTEHRLHSAIVAYDGNQPVWRHLSTARLTMRDFSDNFLAAYLDRNWPQVASSVGAYQIEGEGIRLFSSIQGEYHTILGLPLLPLLSWLTLRGFIDA